MGFVSLRGVAMTIALLAFLAPGVEARGIDAPLPPMEVQAAITDEGTLVSWLPPLYDGGSPVLAYHVYLLIDPIHAQWQQIGSTDGDKLTLLIPLATAGSVYHVTAENELGPSLQSAPASAEGNDQCDPLILSGIPPHPGINWDCIPDPLGPRTPPGVWTWLKLED